MPEGLLRLLLAQETRSTFNTVDPIHVESGSSHRIELHHLRIGVHVLLLFLVCHISCRLPLYVLCNPLSPLHFILLLARLVYLWRLDDTWVGWPSVQWPIKRQFNFSLRFPWEFIDSPDRPCDNSNCDHLLTKWLTKRYICSFSLVMRDKVKIDACIRETCNSVDLM